MSIAMTLSAFSVYGDEVFTSTDLNRRSGTVLDNARRKPVTISRNNEQFALLRREQAALLVETLNRATQAVTLMAELNAVLGGKAPSKEYSWLTVYEKDDLQKMFSEVLSAAKNALLAQKEPDELEALIHEWHESALVAQSGVLDDAMYSQPSDEVPLPEPEDLVLEQQPVMAACVKD